MAKKKMQSAGRYEKYDSYHFYKQLAKLTDNISVILKEVVPDAVDELLNDAVAMVETDTLRLVPVDTYNLKDSFFVDKVKRNQYRTDIIMGYNRYNEAPYAVFVHEIPVYYHDSPTQWKFFEQPVEQMKASLPSLIKGRVRTRIYDKIRMRKLNKIII